MYKRGKVRESGHRSKLEDQFAQILKDTGTEEKYEVNKVPYVVPQSKHNYTIDFTLPNGINLELKGCFRDYDERHKYILVKEQHPDLDLRFVFAQATKKVPGTKMTHAQWAEKCGFQQCDIKDKEKIISWIKE